MKLKKFNEYFNKIEIPRLLVDKLVNIPESGMGYQIVDIILKSGDILRKRNIINSKFLLLVNNEKLETNDIEDISMSENIDTMIISAFPGCGKSHYFRNNKDKIVLDSDSSTFDKSDFPRNYIEHIKSNIGKTDTIMVSSHKEVRDALVENGIFFTLVYPEPSIREEYVQRYIDRGSPESFVKLLTTNWDSWISELEEQRGCDKIKLKKGQYLSDVI